MGYKNFVIFVLGFTCSALIFQSNNNDKTTSLQAVSEVSQKIEESYIDEIAKDKLLDDALKGFVANLDPHSSYWTQEELEKEKADFKGEYVGFGVAIKALKNKGILVQEVMKNGPGDKGGIKVKDLLLEVDDYKLVGNYDEDIKKIRGIKGTSVNVKLMRDGKPVTLKVVRDEIESPSVLSYIYHDKISNKKINFVKVSMFGEKTGVDFILEVYNGLKEKTDGLVIDLRGNSGGLINSSVEMASLFLEKDKKVTYLKSRNGVEESWVSNDEKLSFNDATERVKAEYPQLLDFNKYPVLIMVNNSSASASELFSQALKDYGRAKIIGEKTFGKGSAQKLIRVNSTGGALKLTFAKYFSPSGKSVQAVGVEPDIYASNMELEEAIKKSTEKIYEKSIKGHLKNKDEIEKDDELSYIVENAQYNKLFSYAPFNYKNELDPVSKTVISIFRDENVLFSKSIANNDNDLKVKQ